MPTSVIAQFVSPEGVVTGPSLDVPWESSASQLNVLLNELLEQEEPLPYLFFVSDVEISDALGDAVSSAQVSTEVVLQIRYEPQAIFRVRSVTRCTATLPAHSEAILSVQFAPDGSELATASGDTNVRLWDVSTQTPRIKLEGHKSWVLVVSWSPDARLLASGGMDSKVMVWSPKEGKLLRELKGHHKWVTAISWEPLHRSENGRGERLASASKDCSVRIWNARTGTCELILTTHTAAVTCVRWGGEGFLYSSSQDRTIKVWDPSTGKVIRSLDGHGHWVNTMALSTDYALRCGAFDHRCQSLPDTNEETKAIAQKRYAEASGSRPERLVSGSDDFTLHLWEPGSSKKPLARMAGHQQLVNMVSFSPNQLYIASASFDKSVRLWDAATGRFIVTFRGHVGPVYQVGWSADSRLLLSSSKDSTVKVWEMRTRKLKFDLPGHADEVFAVDWSPDGSKVASGGKDKMLKLWQH